MKSEMEQMFHVKHFSFPLTAQKKTGEEEFPPLGELAQRRCSAIARTSPWHASRTLRSGSSHERLARHLARTYGPMRHPHASL